jgi:hypothetical protein
MRDVLSIVDKAANHDLYIKLVDLTDRIVALSDENNQLKDEKKSLSDLLKLRAEVMYEHPFCFVGEDSVPHCSRCWEADQITVHLYGPHHLKGSPGTGMSCPKCKNEISLGQAKGNKSSSFLQRQRQS